MATNSFSFSWQEVMEHIVEKQTDETRRRWDVAIKDKNFDHIRNIKFADTRPEHFDRALAEGKVSINVYLRRIHNHALGMDWLLKAVIPRLQSAEAALIVGLLVNRTKRRHGEAAATLIAGLSSRFINLPADKVDREIEAAQRRICERLGFDLSSLWQWSADDPDDLVLTHVCRLLDGPPIPERMSAQEYFPWCLQEVRAKKCFGQRDWLPHVLILIPIANCF